MRRIFEVVQLVSASKASVLITGESGTGKEVLARGVHELSPRAGKRFVAINCAAIPDTLLESELFGYEKGAFTGAAKQTIGKIEYANEGTLFLDEIGDLPMPLQAKLLRLLQARAIERLGRRRANPDDVRDGDPSAQYRIADCERFSEAGAMAVRDRRTTGGNDYA